MNVIQKFTIKNLKLNKKRTIVTIIGVMLSTALICAVAGMTTSTRQTLINTAINNNGNYHVCFYNVPKEEIKYITQNANTDNYFFTNSLGYATLEGAQNPNKPYVYVMEYDNNALQNDAIHLIEGRFPTNENELIISEHILTNARVELKIGDTITLNVGKRVLSDGSTLIQNNPLLNGIDEETGESYEESIINTVPKTYIIVGIIKRPNYSLETYSAPGYTVISYLNNTDTLASPNISVLYKNPSKYSSVTEQLLRTIKNDTGVVCDTNTNQDLLRFQGGMSENTLSVIYSIGTVVICIIILSSVFVIRNSFSISVSEKTRQLGILTSIGATKKQIRKTVLLEGFIIGFIAIPLGIICGIIAIIILIWIVNSLVGDLLGNVVFIYSVPLVPILLSIVLSFVTIYLSCIIPARRASKISPIDAIRGNKDIKIKNNKIKTSIFTKKLFGIGGVIASKNLKRSKKKYRTTIISLVVSISIFVSLTSFLQYGKKMAGVTYSDLKYNIAVYGNSEDLYKEIVKLGDITSYSYSYSISANIDIKKYGSDYGKTTFGYVDNNMDINGEHYISIISLNNDYFKEFIKELGYKEAEYAKVAILEDDSMTITVDENGNSQRKINNLYNIKDGDTITLNINNKDTNIRISKRSDKRPMGYADNYFSGGCIFVSQDFMKNYDNSHLLSLHIKSDNATKLENTLIDLRKENPEYSDIDITNYEAYNDEKQRIFLLISIFLYGFITVISLIGVTNIFNTITTNMILRSKEFANLKSIGMTTKEFNRMIRLESILYGLKSLFIGIPLGLFGSYLIYRLLTASIDFGYIIPWEAIVISIIFVFIIVWTTMKYSLHKINKQNIIDTIRNENI